MFVPNNNLKYVITSGFYGTREVFPTGESSIRLTYDRHDDIDDPLLDYIYTLAGKIILRGEDYDWIKIIEDDIAHRGDTLGIAVTDKKTLVEFVPSTTIILNNGLWDIDKCTVELIITTPDRYQDFNKAKVDELNLFDLLISGPFYDVHPLDYVPQFQVNFSPITPPGPGAFDITAQNFAYFPNRKAQYPGFSCDGETAEDGFPSAATKLFDTKDLVELTNNANGIAELNIGAYPFHKDYPTPATSGLDAKAEAWRLYAYRYDIFNNTSAGNAMGYHAYFCWIREIKDVAIGTVMTPDWFFVGVIGGMDRWARPPILVPRTNINRPSFTTEAFPSEAQQRFIQTCYVVGLNLSNINLDTFVGSTFSDGTSIPPASLIVSAVRDEDYKNYYGFDAISNGRALNDVIEFAVNHCDPTLTVKSDFFQINPFTVSPTNYVTGATSFVDDIIMFQKSDVKRAFATNKATKGTYTPEKLFLWLLYMFRVKYKIDGTDFVIEHISSDYFVRAATLDLTTAPLNTLLAATRRYTYDQGMRLPAKETFKFMEGRPQGDALPLDDFNGVPILYDGSNVDRTKDNGVYERVVDSITTDVYYILIHSGGVGYLIDATTKNPYPVQDAADDTAISDDGFVLISTFTQVVGMITTRYMNMINPIIGTNRELNNPLGWANLQDAFYRTDANTSHGLINNNAVTFSSTKYIKNSIPLPFTLCDASTFDPFELIDSELGTGVVKKAEYNFQQSKMTVTLGYPE